MMLLMGDRARFSWARAGGWLMGGLLLISLAGLIGHTVPVGVDFGNTFYAVGRAIWSGQSPYSVRSFLSPPWVLPLIAPLGILPLQWAWGIFTTIGLGAYLIAFVRMRLKPIALALLMLSPFVWFNLYYGNIDWLILLGATLPPQWGIWLLVIKPQMSAVLIALWAYRLWRKRGAVEVVKVLGLPIAAGSLSFMLGIWNTPDFTPQGWWTSAWPMGVVVGVALTWLAFVKDETQLAFAASPFLSPYVAVHSWIVALLPFVTRKKWLLLFIVCAWVAALIRYLPT